MSRKVLLATGAISLGVILAGCNNQPAPDPTSLPTESETSQVQGTSVEVATMEGNHYLVDTDQSTVHWFAQKAVVDTKHNGTVEIKEGTIVLNQDNTDLKGAEFVLDMTTINDQDLSGAMKEKLEGHLKSDDFFAVEAHPTATLIVTSVEQIADGGHMLHGDLTIKGVTNPVSFPADVTLTGDVITANADLTIDRSQWDVQFGSDTFFDDLGDNLIENEITFEIDLTARLENN